MGNRVEKLGSCRLGLLEGALPQVDYLDAYKRTFRLVDGADPERVSRAVLRAPGWVRALAGLRNALVAPLGLKRPPTHTISIPIIDRNANEVVMGMDDSHLDFRLLVRIEQVGERADVTLATAVWFHNRVGRAYFAIIKPFHRLIVRTCLSRQPLDLLGS